MRGLVAGIERCNRLLGRGVAWLCMAVLACQAMAVCLRYVFGVGAIALQEGVVYGHALLFLCASAWVLQVNAHVRVDIVHGRLGARARRAVDALALLGFVLPTGIVIGVESWPYVARAWASLEGSRQAGGLPAVFLLKSAIIVFALSIASQALVTGLRLAFGQPADDWSAPRDS